MVQCIERMTVDLIGNVFMVNRGNRFTLKRNSDALLLGVNTFGLISNYTDKRLKIKQKRVIIQ